MTRSAGPPKQPDEGDELRELAARIARLDAAIYKRFHAGRTQVAGEVTPRMVAVLRHLAVSGPLTVGEQANHLGLSRAAMTELIDRLEDRGLVARMRDEEDRRRVFVWLTDDGRDHVAGLPDADDPLVRAVAAMTAPDRNRLVTGMEALLAAADIETRDEPPANRASTRRRTTKAKKEGSRS